MVNDNNIQPIYGIQNKILGLQPKKKNKILGFKNKIKIITHFFDFLRKQKNPILIISIINIFASLDVISKVVYVGFVKKKSTVTLE